jgi:AcrR family transcriptional regulator
MTTAIPRPAAAPRRRTRPSTQQKLDQLLANAAKLIAEKGYEATSMRALAKAVDVSLAGLYHYFVSKEELLYQLQYRTFASLLEGQEAVAAQAGTPEERLRRMLVGHLDFYQSHPNELKACTYELESLQGELYETIEQLRRRYYQLMTKVVAEFTDGPKRRGKPSTHSRHATLFMFGMLNWIFMWYDPARHGTVPQIGEEMCDLVINGLRRA